MADTIEVMTAAVTSSEAYVGVTAAMIASGLSLDTIRRKWNKGEFPKPHKIGKNLRWRLADIIKWRESQATAAQAQGD